MATIKEEHKAIIGTINPDGTLGKHPALNLNRARYSKPATTQQISPELFVVIPANFNEWDVVQALKDEYAPKAGPVVSKAKAPDKAE